MLKNIVPLVIVAVCISCSSAWAVHREVAEDGQKVDGSLVYKANLITPDGDSSFVSQDLSTYFLIDKKLGLGVDMTACLENDYLSVKPFMTWGVVDGLSLIGGFSTNSAGADYVHTGVWLFKKFGKVSIFLDPRFYFKASSDAEDYFDGFAEIGYALNEKVTLAANVAYDHWWDSGNNWAIIGPVVYWSITDSVTLFSRVARETDFEGSGSTDVRVGIKWVF